MSKILTQTDDERARSDALTELILQRIRTSETQCITFAEFMNMALYEPTLGYYTSTHDLIGRSGDFITAPELGELFAAVLSKKVANLLDRLSGPKVVYEFGAGNGKLATQILKTFSESNVQLDEYAIVEISPTMRYAQQQAIASIENFVTIPIRWYDQIPDEGMNGIVLANELLDAFPVELILIRNQEVYQAYVYEFNSQLRLKFERNVQQNVLEHFDDLELPLEKYDEYSTEIHTHAGAWLRTVAEKLMEGAIVICDYGFLQHEYYHADRSSGTLICHRRHHVLFDPLQFIGCQDITAHLNFSQLEKIAIESGMSYTSFSNLSSFILDFVADNLDLFSSNVVNQSSLKSSTELLTLTMPSEMGEIFKVMVLTNFSRRQM